MAITAFRQVFDLMAKMGLAMRDDPKRVIDAGARLWGEAVDGLALSVEPVLLREDRRAMSNLSVVLRNAGAAPRSLVVPRWLFYYQIELVGPDGSPVRLSPFGHERLKAGRNTEKIDVMLAPGGIVETQIPIGSIFDMRASGEYQAAAWCQLPGGAVLRSNVARLSV